MKKTAKSILSIVLTLIMIFSVATIPASAVNVYEENTYGSLIEVYDYGNEEDKNFFEKIIDLLHWYIARIFVNFDADCPFCGEHFRLPQLANDIEVYYNDAVNAVKNYKGKLTVKKQKEVTLEVKDVSASPLLNIFDTVAKSLCDTKTNTYVFENGVTSDGVKITDVIQPLGREASLTAEGTQSSSAISTENATKVELLTVCTVAEDSHFDGTVIMNPPYNSMIIEPINPAALDLVPIKIIDADIAYPGTLASVSFDKEGRMEKLKISIPVEAEGVASVSTLQTQAACKAEITEEYTFIYG